MKETVKLGIILLVFCLASAGILSYVNGVTAPIISEREEQNAKEAYQQLIPEADEFEALDANELSQLKQQVSKLDSVILAKSAGDTIGYLFTTRGGGYGGDISVITAIVDNAVKDITILKMSETPDIGTKVLERSFQEQYVGKITTEPIAVKKENPGDQDIQAISGSTVSSKGVTDAVNIALEVSEVLNK
ncbi:MAG: FMN-binding protein [Ezakiella sp.]|nr:FMN-binding protein [Ezakiella sp.]MDY3946694.1 FMN-binding protein [Ezakiella sp.]